MINFPYINLTAAHVFSSTGTLPAELNHWIV